jgi:hypothetical protein
MHAMRILLLPMIIYCAKPAALEQAPSGDSAERAGIVLWKELLDCVEEHSRECRATLDVVAQKNSNSEPVRELVTILIEEWDLYPRDPRLERARRVVIPMPPPEEARSLLPAEFQALTIVVSGVITPEGTVEDVELLRPSQYDELNDRVVTAFSQGRYRPAWRRDRFVSQRAEFVYRLEPRP